jgi:hypothetical protein
MRQMFKKTGGKINQENWGHRFLNQNTCSTKVGEGGDFPFYFIFNPPQTAEGRKKKEKTLANMASTYPKKIQSRTQLGLVDFLFYF